MGPRSSPPIVIIAVATLAGAGAAEAGGGGCQPCSPAPPPPPCNCAPTTHNVSVPGVSISTPSITIGIPTIVNGAGGGSASGVAMGSASANAGVSTNVSVSVSSGGTAQNTSGLLGSFGGGGSGSWSPEGGVTTDITEVKVETVGPPPRPAAPVCLQWKAAVRRVAVQAVCIDDKTTPHPASQVFPDKEVAPTYEGEVYRCIAGARMQYTVADFAGQAEFSHGQTITCQKGEALYHTAAGGLQCRPQTPARDCNERSLLRRFGAGIKLMSASGERICAAWGPAPVAAAPGAPLALN